MTGEVQYLWQGDILIPRPQKICEAERCRDSCVSRPFWIGFFHMDLVIPGHALGVGQTAEGISDESLVMIESWSFPAVVLYPFPKIPSTEQNLREVLYSESGWRCGWTDRHDRHETSIDIYFYFTWLDVC